MALSRDIPRIASVIAVVNTELLILSRSDFIGTVGNPSGAEAVEATVGQRLERNDSS